MKVPPSRVEARLSLLEANPPSLLEVHQFLPEGHWSLLEAHPPLMEAHWSLLKAHPSLLAHPSLMEVGQTLEVCSGMLVSRV
eukprot:jgi/Tetstr1/421486/TSEL_012434.t1